MKKKIKYYAIAIIIPLLVGGFSAFLTRNNMNIYDEINVPPFAPPSILFPIVWSVLYILMGISSAMVFLSLDVDFSQRIKALRYYVASLIINFLWNIIFFNLRSFMFSFILLLFLLLLIIKTIYEYFKINKIAAYLQIPYAIWVTFAGVLNLAIWYLNR